MTNFVNLFTSFAASNSFTHLPYEHVDHVVSLGCVRWTGDPTSRGPAKPQDVKRKYSILWGKKETPNFAIQSDRDVTAWLAVVATVSGFDSRRRHFISVCNQPPRSTQPSTLRGTVKWVPAKGRWLCFSYFLCILVSTYVFNVFFVLLFYFSFWLVRVRAIL